MSTITKSKKKTASKKIVARKGLSLPKSTATVEIGGMTYFITPTADMREWLEDIEDILDSEKALREPGESIPFDRVAKELGIKLPPRKKK